MLNGYVNKRRSITPPLFIILLLLAGCNNVGPFVEPVDPGGIPEGPGLFSGESGNLYESKSSDEVNEPESDQNSGAAEFQEFKDYQQWLKLDRNSDEYKEFQQWMRFRQLKQNNQ